MINGVAPSELRAVERTHLAHALRLRQILSHSPPPPDAELALAIRTRRHNHLLSRRFLQRKEAARLQLENQAHRSKLERIRMGNSLYRHFPASPTASVAHNFYHRKRMQLRIETENPEIARRLIEMQASLSAVKIEQDHAKMREVVARLERFPAAERNSSFSHKTRRLKTEPTASPNPLSPSTRNPSAHRPARPF